MLAAGLTVALGLAASGPLADTGPFVPLFTVWTALYAGGFAFVPFAVAVVVAEGFAIRTPWYWLAVGGAIGAAGYLLDDMARGTPWDGLHVSFPLAAGFVAGLVYWLVAGRRAGIGQRPPSGRAG